MSKIKLLNQKKKTLKNDQKLPLKNSHLKNALHKLHQKIYKLRNKGGYSALVITNHLVNIFFRKIKSAPRPPTSGSWGLHLQTLQTAPLIANSWLPYPAPRGANRGRAPPTDCLCPPNENCAPPPSEDCAPKKLTGLGLLERKSRSKLVFFVD